MSEDFAIQSHIQALAERLHHLNHQYYQLDVSEVADQEFDQLLAELQALETAHPELVLPNSPTQRVGGTITKQFPTADGQEMRVRFRDYAFFVPKDLSGHEVVVSGWAYRRNVPKSELQHYAQDAGKTAQEVAAITQDEQQFTFLADGVRVVN